MRADRTARTDGAARLRAVHPMLWAAFASLAVGAVLCVLGWYGMSGERFAERQLPYLASCTVPGAALIIAGTLLLTHGRSVLAAARVEELYGLLVSTQPPPPPQQTPITTNNTPLMIPGGTLWHRADCPLIAGKPQAVPADATALSTQALAPCPICEPPRPPDPATPEQ
ncbi:hypothetical protein [Streptomyces sp. PA5.6]|uniref:hypothetical protein n=1 Tax=Streptomyces sp. PA5.6 TaxID=3035651 RepID=UPI003904CE9C